MAFCGNCGKPIDEGAAFCSNCGAQQGNAAVGAPIASNYARSTVVLPPQKNQSAALVICFFLGVLGIHDFYANKTLHGVLKLVMTLTGVLSIVSWIWTIVNLISIIRGTYTDGYGRTLNPNAAKSTKIIVIVLLILSLAIVPVGVAAAVILVPSLSKMEAKSKASELSPAMGTYKMMQEAYLLESANLGSFRTIGYSVPESSVFTYIDLADTHSGIAGVAAISTEILGDCLAGTAFVMLVKHTPGSYDGNWECSIKHGDGSPLNDGETKACEEVVPTFRRLCN